MSELTTSRSKRFFQHPTVVGGGWALLGIAVTVYLSVGRPKRALTFMVSPAKAIVVKAGEASRLAVSYDGKAINTDITAAQLVIWNAGTESIRPENVLEPVQIVTDAEHPILEITVRKQNRELVNLKVERSQWARGIAALSWRILEAGDGAVLQIIFEGSPATAIRMNGTIEGQGGIKHSEPREKTRPSTYLILIGIGVVSIFLSRFISWKDRRTGGTAWRAPKQPVVPAQPGSFEPRFLLVIGVLMLALTVAAYLLSTPGPPFFF